MKFKIKESVLKNIVKSKVRKYLKEAYDEYLAQGDDQIDLDSEKADIENAGIFPNDEFEIAVDDNNQSILVKPSEKAYATIMRYNLIGQIVNNMKSLGYQFDNEQFHTNNTIEFWKTIDNENGLEESCKSESLNELDASTYFNASAKAADKGQDRRAFDFYQQATKQFKKATNGNYTLAIERYTGLQEYTFIIKRMEGAYIFNTTYHVDKDEFEPRSNDMRDNTHCLNDYRQAAQIMGRIMKSINPSSKYADWHMWI